MHEKSGQREDRTGKPDHYRETHKDGTLTSRQNDNASHDKNGHSASDEYRRHGWKVEYSNESEEGFSKKA
jgi:hypothetical protein